MKSSSAVPFLASAALVSLLTAACSSSSSTSSDAAAGSGGSGTAGSGTAGSGTAGSGAGGTSATGGTKLTGTLGMLGAVQPTVSSLVISNSGETLIYMSSAPITCDMLKTSKWLLQVAAGAQVVEIVIQGDPKVGGAQDAEVNYAPGGKSSAYEVNADTGTVTFTMAAVHGAVEGTVMGTYADGSMVSGSFHADFCDGGQGY